MTLFELYVCFKQCNINITILIDINFVDLVFKLITPILQITIVQMFISIPRAKQNQ